MQIYITTDFIKKYINSEIKYSDAEFTFKVNNNTVTLTERNIIVENELFGTIYQHEINAFYYDETLLVESSDIASITGISVYAYYRENHDDKYMMTEHLEFITDYVGDLYTDSIYNDNYIYYTKGFEHKKPKGNIIGVNLRGNYIYQNKNGVYFIEANGVYYPIYTEIAPMLED